MAKAKSRSTAKTKTSRSSSRSKQSKSLVSNINFRDKKVFGLFIALIAVVGIALVGFSSAASTSFEAEGASKSSTVVIGDDPTLASGGKYVQFSVAETTTTGGQRFPGDPNPLKNNGKAYWGAGISGNGDPSRHETATGGKSLSVRRTFYDWNESKMITTAKADLAANRLPFVSVKTPGWNSVASGAQDAGLDNMLKELDKLNGPVWFTVHHEPEGGCDSSCKGPNGEDDAAGAPGWRAMQKHVRDRMNALKAQGEPIDNIAFMPVLMAWTFNDQDPPKGSGRNAEDWWVPGIWDAYIVDAYADTEGESLLNSYSWKKFESWITEKGLPYGTAEWGLRTLEGGSWLKASGTGTTWTNTECVPSNMVLKPSTAAQEATAAANMKAFWEHSITSKKDMIVYSYFDSCLNSKKGPWTLAKSQLTTFQDILKNDGRVQRVNDLKAGTTTTSSNFGTIKQKISVPADGDYTLWVRMQVPDTTNDSIQAQVGNGTVMNVGGDDIAPGTWTWVNWKGGDKTNVNNLNGLTGGEHEVTLTGTKKDVKIDRVIVANQTCKPENFGDRCTQIAPDEPDPTPAVTATITTPANNAPALSGKVTVKVQTTGNTTRTTFRPNNVFPPAAEGGTVEDTDANGAYNWTWDTANGRYPDGQYTLVTRTGIGGQDYIENKINVTIKNTKPTPSDTTPPAPVTNLNRAIGFSFTSFKCGTKLMWSASTSNDVEGYKVVREGLNTKTSDLQYVDEGLVAGKAYTYSVSAYDKAGNTSRAVSIGAKYNQFLGWCWFE